MTQDTLLSTDAIALWREILRSGAPDAAERAREHYLARVLPDILTRLETLPEHRSLCQAGWDTLVSLMGMSPETTIITAALLRPRTLVILASEDQHPSVDLARRYLDQHCILLPSETYHSFLPPADTSSIYHQVRQHLSGARVLVDITGGKKVMGATAAQAAWEANVRLCYLDSHHYDPETRRPVPGTERLIVLANPSDQKLRELRGRALEYCRQVSYSVGASVFEQSAQLRSDHDLDEVGLALALCYQAWMDVDLERLARAVSHARDLLAQGRLSLLNHRLGVEPLLNALQRVCRGDEEPEALVASCWALAQIYAAQGRQDFACLLTYRSMEQLVHWGLCRKTGGRFRPGRPDYSLFGILTLQDQYAEVCRELEGASVDRLLPARVGLLDGFVLLCLVDNLHTRVGRKGNRQGAIKWLRGLSEMRNQSVLAHGQRNLSAEDRGMLEEAAHGLAEGILGADYPKLQKLEQDLRQDPFQEMQRMEGVAPGSAW